MIFVLQQSRQSLPYPYKAGREPALAVHDTTPPPLLVSGVHYFNDITGLEAQLLIIHGDMVPEGLGINYAAIADQLQRKKEKKTQQRGGRLSFNRPSSLQKIGTSTHDKM